MKNFETHTFIGAIEAHEVEGNWHVAFVRGFAESGRNSDCFAFAFDGYVTFIGVHAVVLLVFYMRTRV